jgi:hypothetical protein
MEQEESNYYVSNKIIVLIFYNPSKFVRRLKNQIQKLYGELYNG